MLGLKSKQAFLEPEF